MTLRASIAVDVDVDDLQMAQEIAADFRRALALMRVPGNPTVTVIDPGTESAEVTP